LRLPTTINCGGEGAVLQDVTLQCGIFLTFIIFRIPTSFNFIEAHKELNFLLSSRIYTTLHTQINETYVSSENRKGN
jgi:hypothetical protein